MKELIGVVIVLLLGLAAGSLIESTQMEARTHHQLWLEHQNHE